jgi:hypothetical protein
VIVPSSEIGSLSSPESSKTHHEDHQAAMAHTHRVGSKLGTETIRAMTHHELAH